MNIPFQLSTRKEFQALFDQSDNLEPITVGIVCPETMESLIPVIHATNANIIKPILIGSCTKMQEIVEKTGRSLTKYECIDFDNEEEAVWHAISMAQDEKIEALMKGSLSTHSIISAAVNTEKGIRIGKRISHIMLMDIPSYKKPLMITDAAFNVFPTLDDKKDIVQNAINLAISIGIETPKVALLSAISKVSEDIPSSLDCNELRKMAEQGIITGGIVEGPLAFDVAISEKAANIKKIQSKISGNIDIALVHNIDAGNILFKALEHLANATSFGIGVGGKVPIILTSRSTSLESRIGSCILAKIIVRANP